MKLRIDLASMEVIIFGDACETSTRERDGVMYFSSIGPLPKLSWLERDCVGVKGEECAMAELKRWLPDPPVLLSLAMLAEVECLKADEAPVDEVGEEGNKGPALLCLRICEVRTADTRSRFGSNDGESALRATIEALLFPPIECIDPVEFNRV